MTEAKNKFISEFDSISGHIRLKAQTGSGKQIFVKIAHDSDFVVYYHDTTTGDETALKFDAAWVDTLRDGGTLEFFVAGKLKGLRDIKGENELEAEVEKRFKDLKEIDNGELYNEVLPVVRLFQKTGVIRIPSVLIKCAVSTLDNEPLLPLTD